MNNKFLELTHDELMLANGGTEADLGLQYPIHWSYIEAYHKMPAWLRALYELGTGFIGYGEEWAKPGKP